MDHESSKQVYNNTARAWPDKVEAKMISEKKIKELKPKADYYTTVLESKNTYTTTLIAKERGMSAKTLNSTMPDKVFSLNIAIYGHCIQLIIN